jgi:hypothetical protein
MAETSDGIPDDSTASTTNRSITKRSGSPSGSITKKKMAKTQQMKLYPLQFEYSVKTANVNIAQSHGRVLQALSASHGDAIILYDKTGTVELDPAHLPRTKEEWDKSFYLTTVTNSRNADAIIKVGHKIAMSISISDLKKGIHATLRQYDGFIKYNVWDEHIDARTAGYLANLHPVHHNRETICCDVENILLASLRADNAPLEFPQFLVVPSTANDNKSNKKVSSRLLAIECKNKIDAVLCKKLVAAYTQLPTKVDPVVGAFIPFDAKYTDLEVFRRLIHRQNRYLSDHRNIPINGLDHCILSYVFENGHNLEDEIMLRAQIVYVDESANRDHIGRYNLSTTSEHYQAAIVWL